VSGDARQYAELIAADVAKAERLVIEAADGWRDNMRPGAIIDHASLHTLAAAVDRLRQARAA
jgi:hypothetical protein